MRISKIIYKRNHLIITKYVYIFHIAHIFKFTIALINNLAQLCGERTRSFIFVLFVFFEIVTKSLYSLKLCKHIFPVLAYHSSTLSFFFF